MNSNYTVFFAVNSLLVNLLENYPNLAHFRGLETALHMSLCMSFSFSKCREVYHTKRMQHVICVKWSADNKYILSGSDEMNIRLWKANASEKLGVVSPTWSSFCAPRIISPLKALSVSAVSMSDGCCDASASFLVDVLCVSCIL